MYFLKNAEKISIMMAKLLFFLSPKSTFAVANYKISNITNDEKMGTIFYQLTLKKLAIPCILIDSKKFLITTSDWFHSLIV